MKQLTFMGGSGETYATPTTRTIEIKLSGNMMLINSNGTTGNATLSALEEEDYSTTTWQ